MRWVLWQCGGIRGCQCQCNTVNAFLTTVSRAGSGADTERIEGAPLIRPHIASAEAADNFAPALLLDIGICSVERDSEDVLEARTRRKHTLRMLATWGAGRAALVCRHTRA